MCLEEYFAIIATCWCGYSDSFDTILILAFSPCASFPCLNEATCADNETHYECMCPQDFVGDHCEKGK